MKISQHDITDFYKQLALLTKSGLPIPDTLKNLAGTFNKKEFNALVEKLGDDTATGMKLSEAMKKNPEVFQSFFIRMVELGECRGTLPKVLDELSAVARMNYRLAVLVRDILFYPLITVSIAFIVFIAISYFIIPGFGKIYNELLEGSPLPALTEFVLWISSFVEAHIVIVAFLYFLYLGAAIWIFTGRRSGLILFNIIKHLPLSEIVFYNFGMARICSLWSVMMRQQIPEPKSFAAISEMVDMPELSSAMKNLSAGCDSGTPLLQALEKEKNISSLLLLTVKNCPENKLPDELDNLAELFRERGQYGYRRVGMAWEIISVATMIVITGGIIIILFMPLMLNRF